jgi:hypothetical protein
MAEQKINITAKEVNADIIKNKSYTADLIKNKAYTTSVPNTKLNVNLKGFGESSLPVDSLFRRATDIVNNNDISIISARPSFHDIFSSISVITNYLLNKSINDVETTNDNISINSLKVTSDNYTKTDIVSSLFSKSPIEDLSINSDLISVQFTSSLADQFNSSNELINKTIEKSFSNVTSNQELVTLVSTFRSILEDGVAVTDDFCQICPDDDQTATFTKVIKHDTTNSELVNKTQFKSVNDSLLQVESLSKQFDKSLVSQNSSLASFVQIRNEKSLLETQKNVEEGKIFNQNYFLEDYVEPGYTGVIVLFGVINNQTYFLQDYVEAGYMGTSRTI